MFHREIEWELGKELHFLKKCFIFNVPLSKSNQIVIKAARSNYV